MHADASSRPVSVRPPLVQPRGDLPASLPAVVTRQCLRLDQGWRFRRCDESAVEQGEEVALPHCPFVPDLDGRNHWFGECEYRRTIAVSAAPPGARWELFFGAAMHTACVLIDGREVGRHAGGYLPFTVDVTNALHDGAGHELVVRLDNRHDPDVPPGKPFDELDFCWYGGLYRDAELRLIPAVHITDPVSADEIAGGGVFVRTLEADETRATLGVHVQVRNSGAVTRDLRVQVELVFAGVNVAVASVAIPGLRASHAVHADVELAVARPKLWAPDTPALHELRVAVVAHDGTVLDAHRERIGIRRIHFSRSGGFVINGRRLRLRGTNRHQEFPRVGYAAPRAAQFRDARLIKEAGFDYVRLSHYPQSPEFLAACDELGLVVMNCLPGWQFFGGDRFRTACCEKARQMIRRDRNHPCVVLWELSLNETIMDDAFMARMHAIGHEEYPGDQMFTCGWIDRFDVYLRSRQHGQIHSWKNGDKALVVAEYGDWEFFAANEGFDQKTGAGLLAASGTSRKFRRDGERGLRQQAANHMHALEDMLASPAVLDGQWSMFDYARGYDPMRAACGVMDVFRLPKFSWHFYRSQRDPGEGGVGWTGGPVVFIASHGLPDSELSVPVFSNCEVVELRLNGELVPGRAKSELRHLPHPPWFFEAPRFAPGVLEATGFIGGQPVCRHRVAAPASVAALTLRIDDLAIRAATGEPDLLLAHAELRDAQGTLCVENQTSEVRFSLEGDGRLLGPAVVAAEAGIASTVVRVPADSRGWLLRAEARHDPRLTAQCDLRAAPDAPERR